LAEAVQAMLKQEYDRHKPEIRIFSGEVNKNAAKEKNANSPEEKQRDIIVKWINQEDTNVPMVLIQMQKSGGFGLSLKKVRWMIDLEGKDFNPFVKYQNECRIFRADTEGLRTVISTQRGIFSEEHYKIIQEEKMALDSFLWSEDKEPVERFQL